MVHLQCLSFFLRKLFLLFGCKGKTKIRDFSAEGPPVPIPNTEVKLCWGDNTCLETSREDSSLRIFFILANNEEVGIPTAEGPPVPIPNTEVKLCWGDNTCLETSREDSSMPTPSDTANSLPALAVLVFIPRRHSPAEDFSFLLSSVGRAHDC